MKKTDPTWRQLFSSLVSIAKREFTGKRGYSGAQTGRLLSDFTSVSYSADSEIRAALKVLRARCRDRANNDPYAKRFLQTMVTNVVGENGMNMQSRARDEQRPGQAEGSLDIVANKIVETEFKKWSKSVDVSGRLTWIDAQKMFIETLVRDGEVVIRHHVTNEGYKIEFIEPDFLDETYEKKLKNGNQIIMGVELDAFRKPVAYYFVTGRSRERIPASQIIHSFMSDRSDQTRGVPWMAPVLKRLKMLDGYEEAELVAARIGAAKLGFITTEDGDGYTGDSTQGNTPIMSGEPGTISQLATGQTFTSWDPDHPVSAFKNFQQSMLRGIASGLGISYSTLANDLEGVSYSSIRQGTIEDRDNYRMVQKFMVQHFAEPIFREWLLIKMSMNGFPLPITKYDKFADNVNFRARGFQWVDPLKEIKAAETAVQNGFISMQDVASNYGRDIEDVFEQVQRDKIMAEKYGIDLAFQPFGAKQIDPNIGGEDEDTQD